MNVLETEWWTIGIPPEWWADQEDDSILVGDRDDVGCIEISTLHKEKGAFTDVEVRTLAQENSESDWSWDKSTLGPFAGVSTHYREEEDAVREWYVAADGVLLFVTYSCDVENEGLDEAAVDEILSTLALVEQP